MALPDRTRLHVVKDGEETGEVSAAEWEAAFDLFWSDYPRKVGKHAARLVWQRVRPRTQEQFDAICRALARSCRAWDERGERQYIPHARTWLQQRRYEDEEA